jgi:hypothetical protein
MAVARQGRFLLWHVEGEEKLELGGRDAGLAVIQYFVRQGGVLSARTAAGLSAKRGDGSGGEGRGRVERSSFGVWGKCGLGR